MNVLFVNMPFCSIRPAIGISLLKSLLRRIDVESDIAYLNLRLAQSIGVEAYEAVAESAPMPILFGDWLFSGAVFERFAEDGSPYLDMVAKRYGPEATGSSEIPDRLRDLARIRARVDAYLDDCMASVPWEKYDVVGFSTTFNQNMASLALARRIRQRYPDITIVFGGANCEGPMGLQLHRSFPYIDFVCSGEADIGFPRLIERLRAREDVHGIPGVISRRGGESYYSSLRPERVNDLDALPFPDYDEYFDQCSGYDVHAKTPWVLMETSRGCWWGEKHHCTFCGLNGTSMEYRSKSQKRALDEIVYLTGRHATRHVGMVDNILDMKYFRELLPTLKQRGLRLDIFYATKANLTKNQVRLLQEAGVTRIQPGIESFSTHVLHLMRKGATGMQNLQLLKWCKEFGLHCEWNLLYGFPGEEAVDYESQVPLVESLHHLDPPEGGGPILLHRFSPNHSDAERLGLCNVRADRAHQYIYDLPAADIENIAYYFEHDYADGRNVESYTRCLTEAVDRWMSNAASSALVFFDDDETLRISDHRAGVAQTSTSLAGWKRELYRYCDENRTRKRIIEFGQPLGAHESEIDAFLQQMLAARLMACSDERYISLAIPGLLVKDLTYHASSRAAVKSLVVEEMQAEGSYELMLEAALARFLVARVAEKKGTTVPRELLQAAGDRLRAKLGLHRVEAFQAWLAEFGISPEALNRMLKEEALIVLMPQMTQDPEAFHQMLAAKARGLLKEEWALREAQLRLNDHLWSSGEYERLLRRAYERLGSGGDEPALQPPPEAGQHGSAPPAAGRRRLAVLN